MSRTFIRSLIADPPGVYFYVIYKRTWRSPQARLSRNCYATRSIYCTFRSDPSGKEISPENIDRIVAMLNIADDLNLPVETLDSVDWSDPSLRETINNYATLHRLAK
jgi:hypothetical protein